MKTLRLNFVMAVLLGGCLGTYSGPGEDPGNLPPDPGAVNDPGNNPGNNPGPMSCDPGRTYVGFDGLPLQAGRPDGDIGIDRGRIKPYSALAGEYTRTIGKAPASLAGKASSFTTMPNRWYVEPISSAVTLYASLELAFDGCLDLTAMPAEFATAPDATRAATQCAAWANTFWNRAATQADIDACVKVAVTDSASENDARRRWAYTCASVLSAAGFLTY